MNIKLKRHLAISLIILILGTNAAPTVEAATVKISNGTTGLLMDEYALPVDPPPTSKNDKLGHPDILALDTRSRSQNSARKRLPITVQKLSKKDFKSLGLVSDSDNIVLI